MLNCKVCGYEVPETANFCDNCGARIEIQAPPQTIENVPDMPPQTPMNAPNSFGAPQPNMPPQAPMNEQNSWGAPQPNMPPQAPMNQQNSWGTPIPNLPTQAPMSAPFLQDAQPLEKKSKKGLIIGLVAFALISIATLVVVFVFLLPALNKQDNENLGLWIAAEVEIFDFSTSIDDVLGTEPITLEIYEDGTSLLIYQGVPSYGEWEMSETSITITDHTGVFYGKFDGGELILSSDLGYDLIFNRDGKIDSSTSDNGISTNPQVDISNLKDYWNRSWFGAISTYEATGKFLDVEYDMLDAFLVVDIGDDNKGKFSIYALDGPGEAFIVGNCEATGEALICSNVYMGETALDSSDWVFESVSGYPDKYTLFTTISDIDGDIIEFELFFKPYGASWDLEVQDDISYDLPNLHDLADTAPNPQYTIDNVTDTPAYNSPYALGIYE